MNDNWRSGDLPSQEEFQDKLTEMETARKKFFTKKALTDSTLRNQALDEYQATAEGMSQIHQRLETFISGDYSETSTIHEGTNEITPQMVRMMNALAAVMTYFTRQRERSGDS